MVQLLVTQAVRGGSEEVKGWVAHLPSHLVRCLGEGEEGREEVQVVLRCCLHLAKTANSALAAAFLAQMPNITGEQIHCSAPTLQPSWPMSSVVYVYLIDTIQDLSPASFSAVFETATSILIISSKNLGLSVGCTTEDFVEVFNGHLPFSLQIGCHLELVVILVV